MYSVFSVWLRLLSEGSNIAEFRRILHYRPVAHHNIRSKKCFAGALSDGHILVATSVSRDVNVCEIIRDSNQRTLYFTHYVDVCFYGGLSLIFPICGSCQTGDEIMARLTGSRPEPRASFYSEKWVSTFFFSERKHHDSMENG